MFLRIADKVDVLASKEKAFFASCKRLKASERNDEYEKVNLSINIFYDRFWRKVTELE